MSEQQVERKIIPAVHSSPVNDEAQTQANDAYLRYLRTLGPDMLVQTDRQPVWWECFNPECLPDKRNHRKRFVFQSDYGECPKCKSGQPTVSKRVLIHFLVANPKGEISGEHGKRYSIACDLKRYHVATPANGEAGSGDIRAVNCPGCIKAVKSVAVANGYNLKLEG